MAKLLYIESSPRKERSYSIAVAKEFLDAYRTANPGDTVETIDLWDLDLPEFDGATINAKYQVMHGESPTDAEKSAWERVRKVFDHFNGADKYLFSVPMWNFGIPYKLKHYIDVIAQPGMAFSFSPESGYTGLVEGKVAVVYAQGGSYGDSAEMDFQSRYMDLLLGFFGLTDVTNIVVGPTANPLQSAEAKTQAIARARDIAAAF